MTAPLDDRAALALLADISARIDGAIGRAEPSPKRSARRWRFPAFRLSPLEAWVRWEIGRRGRR